MKTSFKSLLTFINLVLLSTLLLTSCKEETSIPLVKTLEVTEITEVTATAGGEITSDGGATVTARGVCWGTNATPTISNNKTLNGKGVGSFTSSLTDLTENTTYYVRAYATNTNGVGYGKPLAFTTEKKVIETSIPSVSTKAVSEISQRTAMSGGYIISDGGEPITARGICWSIGQTPTISDHKTIDGSGVGDFSSSLIDLSSDKKYYVRAYATNSKGTGYGNIISFTTLKILVQTDSFTDSRDGYVYKTVTIGEQVWMAENLRYLPYVDDTSYSATSPFYYVYDYHGTNVVEAKTTENYIVYGVLYNWSSACSSCPDGWHLPSDEEWMQLTNFLGGLGDEGGKMKEEGYAHWSSPNKDATNESGFTGLPGGYRINKNGFLNITWSGGWWGSTQKNNTALVRSLGAGNNSILNSYFLKASGYSVRCIKD